MDLQLKGKVAIVTGGARGIGRVTCQTFAREGANVIVADIASEEERATWSENGKSTEQECRELGVKATYVKTDVTQLDSALKMRDAAMSEFGRIDILVNNAFRSWRGLFWELDPAKWIPELHIILLGSMYCSKAVVDPMMAQHSGAIVNIASDAGRGTEDQAAIYGAAKSGVIGLTRGLARDLGPSGIRVNCVSPGRTMTENYHAKKDKALGSGEAEAKTYLEREKRALRMYALRKFGEPQDVANMIVFLASNAAAGQITGQTVSVNGGYLMP